MLQLYPMILQSGWGDSNSRPPGPKPGTLNQAEPHPDIRVLFLYQIIKIISSNITSCIFYILKKENKGI